jgi:hypothetical protein
MSTSRLSVGLDVHKDSVTIAVFRNRDPEPMRVAQGRATDWHPTRDFSIMAGATHAH